MKRILFGVLLATSVFAKIPSGSWIENPKEAVNNSSMIVMNIDNGIIVLSKAEFNGESIQYIGKYNDLDSTLDISFSKLDFYHKNKESININESLKIDYMENNGMLYLKYEGRTISMIMEK